MNIFNIKKPNFMNKFNICDSECLRNKKLNELEQKYYDAKNSLESAPDVYDRTRKDYYIFKYGLNKYNSLLEEEYKKEIIVEKEKLQSAFNEKYDKISYNIQSLKELQSYSKIKTPNSYIKYFLEGFENINQTEEELIAGNLSNQISLNSRKSYYELESFMTLRTYYYYYYIFYYVFLIILFILFIKKNNISYYIKFFILIMLIFYPFYISYLVNKLSILLTKIYNKSPIHFLMNL